MIPQMNDDPQARSRALAAMIAVTRDHIVHEIEGADDLRKPVPAVIRKMPADLSAWAKMVQQP